MTKKSSISDIIHLLPDHTRTLLSLSSKKLQQEYIDEDRIQAFSVLLQTIVNIHDALPPVENNKQYGKNGIFNRSEVIFQFRATDKSGLFRPLIQRQHIHLEQGVNVKEVKQFDYMYEIKVSHDSISSRVLCTTGGSHWVFNANFDKVDIRTLRFFIYAAIHNGLKIKASAFINCESSWRTSMNHFIHNNKWTHLRGDPKLPASILDFTFEQYASNILDQSDQSSPNMRHARYVFKVIQSLRDIITKTSTHKPLMTLTRGYNPNKSKSTSTPSK